MRRLAAPVRPPADKQNNRRGSESQYLHHGGNGQIR